MSWHSLEALAQRLIAGRMYEQAMKARTAKTSLEALQADVNEKQKKEASQQSHTRTRHKHGRHLGMSWGRCEDESRLIHETSARAKIVVAVCKCVCVDHS